MTVFDWHTGEELISIPVEDDRISEFRLMIAGEHRLALTLDNGDRVGLANLDEGTYVIIDELEEDSDWGLRAFAWSDFFVYLTTQEESVTVHLTLLKKGMEAEGESCAGGDKEESAAVFLSELKEALKASADKIEIDVWLAGAVESLGGLRWIAADDYHLWILSLSGVEQEIDCSAYLRRNIPVLRLSKDRKRLLVAGGRLVLFDTEAWTPYLELPHMRGRFSTFEADISPDASLVASVGVLGEVYVWDARVDATEEVVEPPAIFSILPNPAGGEVYCSVLYWEGGNEAYSICRYDLESGEFSRFGTTVYQDSDSLTVSVAGEAQVARVRDGALEFVEIKAGQTRVSLQCTGTGGEEGFGEMGRIEVLATSRNRRWAAVRGNCRLWLLDLVTGVATGVANSFYNHDFLLTEDGRCVFAGSLGHGEGN